MIDTDGNLTTGIFLDPNGNFIITDSMIFGRIFGGGSESELVHSDLGPTDPTFQHQHRRTTAVRQLPSRPRWFCSAPAWLRLG